MKTLAILVLSFITATAIAKPLGHYRFRVLEPLTSPGLTYAAQINDSGTIIGTAFTTNGRPRAVLWVNGAIYDLGLLPGSLESRGTAINNLGQFIADVPGAYFGASPVAVPPGYSLAGGADLNDSGVVAGNIVNQSSGGGLGFIYQNGALSGLPPLIPGGYAAAIAINNAGQVLAAAQKTQSDAVPVIYSGNAVVDLSGALTAASFRITAQGYGINDAGHVTGWGEITNSAVHAFLYRNGVVTDIAPFDGYDGSQAWGLNNSDQVVGTFFNSETETHTSFLWDNGTIHDLAKFVVPHGAWRRITVTGINNRGAIIGYAARNDIFQAFVLEPVGREK
jgi:probable HAF family extracellular repeat protein